MRSCWPSSGRWADPPVLWTRFRAPAATLVEGWERANVFLEGVVRAALPGAPGRGGPAALSQQQEACRAAAELLVQGDREAAKDLLRALARAREAGVVAPDLVPALSRLLQGFRAWTADEEFLARYQAGLEGLEGEPPPRQSPRRGTAAPGLSVVAAVAERLWGLWPEAPDGTLHLAPKLEETWPGMSLHGLRVGRTRLDLRFERAGPGYRLQASRTHGPRIRLVVWLEELEPSALWIDDEPLGAQRAVFELSGDHELRIAR